MLRTCLGFLNSIAFYRRAAEGVGPYGETAFFASKRLHRLLCCSPVLLFRNLRQTCVEAIVHFRSFIASFSTRRAVRWSSARVMPSYLPRVSSSVPSER